MGVWCCHTIDCLVKLGAIFEEVSSHWSICFDVYPHFEYNTEDSTATNTVCGLFWSNILHVVFSSGKWNLITVAVMNLFCK